MNVENFTPAQKNIFDNLSGVEKVLFKASYDFNMNYEKGATLDTAFAAGMEKIGHINTLMAEEAKPKTYINLSTGKKIVCTENELMGMNA